MANKKEKKDFIVIHSSIDINVTCGLQANDFTRKDSDIPNRLNIKSLWPKATCMIREGKGVYPSYIEDWATVKQLVLDGYLTLGDYVDEADPKVVETKRELDRQINEINNNMKKDSKKSLADIADQEA